MKLTASQIDQLFTFTRQHYVEWYDLQSELVDHLANAIETQWQENPKLIFDEALNREFKKFGVFGFMDVVEKRQAVLCKKYNGLVWQHFKIFFGIPKIVLTIAMMLVLYSILKVSTYSEWIVISLYFILIGFTFYELFKNNRIRKRKKQTQEKRWLFEEIINQYGGFSGVVIFQFNIFVQIFNHSEKYLSNDYWMMGLSFFSVVVILVLFIIFKIIPAKAEEYLQTTYPEYKVVKL
ncbi:hypothetical protein SAMN05444395_101490 [Flavobacterium fryxellicola]|uniref:Uncharacterized protein n=1 Tax=Flavobacterium fryxellicola TaxID=249352 RepID=A0A168AIJ3_9FLAO|nr:hypothetical protein [Flavobacterium fryxellicola]OAB31506.1 hypothetical protein FBFR_01370 [Flavobacterium fryxellicola]SHN53220.1 hypothetical protein SAMN05444395_101490 [Flavobacterium fryxellicola]